MIIGYIHSEPTMSHQEGVMSTGRFELPINIELDEAKGDVPGYIKASIAGHLAKCVQTTKIPLNVGMWNVSFTQEAQRMFNLPAGFSN